ncbi:MAG: hypothetical protein P4L69_07010 [Desulfosporosinus sp.]|nr:hypothetical protein [Desulfosporosinus sp.]
MTSTVSANFLVPANVQGFIDSAPLLFPSRYVPSRLNAAATVSYVNSMSGGSTPQKNIIYMSAVGSTAPDGLTLSTAFDNLADAVAAAAAATPAYDNRFVVYCTDAMTLSLTQNLTVPSWVDIYAPNAYIDDSAFTLTIEYPNTVTVLTCNVANIVFSSMGVEAPQGVVIPIFSTLNARNVGSAITVSQQAYVLLNIDASFNMAIVARAGGFVICNCNVWSGSLDMTDSGGEQSGLVFINSSMLLLTNSVISAGAVSVSTVIYQGDITVSGNGVLSWGSSTPLDDEFSQLIESTPGLISFRSPMSSVSRTLRFYTTFNIEGGGTTDRLMFTVPVNVTRTGTNVKIEMSGFRLTEDNPVPENTVFSETIPSLFQINATSYSSCLVNPSEDPAVVTTIKATTAHDGKIWLSRGSLGYFFSMDMEEVVWGPITLIADVADS